MRPLLPDGRDKHNTEYSWKGHSGMPLGAECQGCVCCCFLGFSYDGTNESYKPNGTPCKYIGENGDGSGFGCTIYEHKMDVCNGFRCLRKFNEENRIKEREGRQTWTSRSKVSNRGNSGTTGR